MVWPLGPGLHKVSIHSYPAWGRRQLIAGSDESVLGLFQSTPTPRGVGDGSIPKITLLLSGFNPLLPRVG